MEGGDEATFINLRDEAGEPQPRALKKARIEFGVEYNEYEEREIRIIKVYTPYDPPLIHDYKQLRWRRAQYRPERQDGKVLYWIFAARVLDDILVILEKHGYKVSDKDLAERMKTVSVEAKKTFAEYKVDEEGLKLINEVARPGTSRWAERVLREQHNFQVLMAQNSNLGMNFSLDNSREVFVMMKELNATFKIVIPLKYPNEIPVVKLEGIWKDTNYTDQSEVAYYKKIVVACLGDLKKRWKPQMTVAHFIKLFANYLAAAQYNEPLKSEVTDEQ